MTDNIKYLRKIDKANGVKYVPAHEQAKRSTKGMTLKDFQKEAALLDAIRTGNVKLIAALTKKGS